LTQFSGPVQLTNQQFLRNMTQGGHNLARTVPKLPDDEERRKQNEAMAMRSVLIKQSVEEQQRKARQDLIDRGILKNTEENPVQQSVLNQRTVPRMTIAQINAMTRDEMRERIKQSGGNILGEERSAVWKFLDFIDLPRNSIFNVAFTDKPDWEGAAAGLGTMMAGGAAIGAGYGAMGGSLTFPGLGTAVGTVGGAAYGALHGAALYAAGLGASSIIGHATLSQEDRKQIRISSEEQERASLGMRRVYFSEVLKRFGVENRTAQAILGIAGDILLDPLSYATGGGTVRAWQVAGTRGAQQLARRSGTIAIESRGIRYVKDAAKEMLAKGRTITDDAGNITKIILPDNSKYKTLEDFLNKTLIVDNGLTGSTLQDIGVGLNHIERLNKAFKMVGKAANMTRKEKKAALGKIFDQTRERLLKYNRLGTVANKNDDIIAGMELSAEFFGRFMAKADYQTHVPFMDWVMPLLWKRTGYRNLGTNMPLLRIGQRARQYKAIRNLKGADSMMRAGDATARAAIAAENLLELGRFESTASKFSIAAGTAEKATGAVNEFISSLPKALREKVTVTESANGYRKTVSVNAAELDHSEWRYVEDTVGWKWDAPTADAEFVFDTERLGRALKIKQRLKEVDVVEDGVRLLDEEAHYARMHQAYAQSEEAWVQAEKAERGALDLGEGAPPVTLEQTEKLAKLASRVTDATADLKAALALKNLSAHQVGDILNPRTNILLDAINGVRGEFPGQGIGIFEGPSFLSRLFNNHNVKMHDLGNKISILRHEERLVNRELGSLQKNLANSTAEDTVRVRELRVKLDDINAEKSELLGDLPPPSAASLATANRAREAGFAKEGEEEFLARMLDAMADQAVARQGGRFGTKEDWLNDWIEINKGGETPQGREVLFQGGPIPKEINDAYIVHKLNDSGIDPNWSNSATDVLRHTGLADGAVLRTGFTTNATGERVASNAVFIKEAADEETLTYAALVNAFLGNHNEVKLFLPSKGGPARLYEVPKELWPNRPNPLWELNIDDVTELDDSLLLLVTDRRAMKAIRKLENVQEKTGTIKTFGPKAQAGVSKEEAGFLAKESLLASIERIHDNPRDWSGFKPFRSNGADPIGEQASKLRSEQARRFKEIGGLPPTAITEYGSLNAVRILRTLEVTEPLTGEKWLDMLRLKGVDKEQKAGFGKYGWPYKHIRTMFQKGAKKPTHTKGDIFAVPEEELIHSGLLDYLRMRRGEAVKAEDIENFLLSQQMDLELLQKIPETDANVWRRGRQESVRSIRKVQRLLHERAGDSVFNSRHLFRADDGENIFMAPKWADGDQDRYADLFTLDDIFEEHPGILAYFNRYKTHEVDPLTSELRELPDLPIHSFKTGGVGTTRNERPTLNLAIEGLFSQRLGANRTTRIRVGGDPTENTTIGLHSLSPGDYSRGTTALETSRLWEVPYQYTKDDVIALRKINLWTRGLPETVTGPEGIGGRTMNRLEWSSIGEGYDSRGLVRGNRERSMSVRRKLLHDAIMHHDGSIKTTVGKKLIGPEHGGDDATVYLRDLIGSTKHGRSPEFLADQMLFNNRAYPLEESLRIQQGTGVVEIGKVHGTGYSEYHEIGGMNTRTFFLRAPLQLASKYPELFVGDGHFPGALGYIAHIRVSDRMENGRRILQIEELQSDTLQAGQRTQSKLADAIQGFTSRIDEKWRAGREIKWTNPRSTLLATILADKSGSVPVELKKLLGHKGVAGEGFREDLINYYKWKRSFEDVVDKFEKRIKRLTDSLFSGKRELDTLKGKIDYPGTKYRVLERRIERLEKLIKEQVSKAKKSGYVIRTATVGHENFSRYSVLMPGSLKNIDDALREFKSGPLPFLDRSAIPLPSGKHTTVWEKLGLRRIIDHAIKQNYDGVSVSSMRSADKLTGGSPTTEASKYLGQEDVFFLLRWGQGTEGDQSSATILRRLHPGWDPSDTKTMDEFPIIDKQGNRYKVLISDTEEYGSGRGKLHRWAKMGTGFESSGDIKITSKDEVIENISGLSEDMLVSIGNTDNVGIGDHILKMEEAIEDILLESVGRERGLTLFKMVDEESWSRWGEILKQEELVNRRIINGSEMDFLLQMDLGNVSLDQVRAAVGYRRGHEIAKYTQQEIAAARDEIRAKFSHTGLLRANEMTIKEELRHMAQRAEGGDFPLGSRRWEELNRQLKDNTNELTAVNKEVEALRETFQSMLMASRADRLDLAIDPRVMRNFEAMMERLEKAEDAFISRYGEDALPKFMPQDDELVPTQTMEYWQVVEEFIRKYEEDSGSLLNYRAGGTAAADEWDQGYHQTRALVMGRAEGSRFGVGVEGGIDHQWHQQADMIYGDELNRLSGRRDSSGQSAARAYEKLIIDEVFNFIHSQPGVKEAARKSGMIETKRLAEFTPDPKLRSALVRRYDRTGARQLYQMGDGDVARASVEFTEQGGALIRALDKPDIGSFIHEIGHIIRRNLSQEDITALEKRFGIEDGYWSVAHEEEFAQAFMQFVMNGVPPRPELQGAFDAIKTSMRRIYENAYDEPINGSLRNAFENAFGATTESRARAKRYRTLQADENRSQNRLNAASARVTENSRRIEETEEKMEMALAARREAMAPLQEELDAARGTMVHKASEVAEKFERRFRDLTGAGRRGKFSGQAVSVFRHAHENTPEFQRRLVIDAFDKNLATIKSRFDMTTGDAHAILYAKFMEADARARNVNGIHPSDGHVNSAFEGNIDNIMNKYGGREKIWNDPQIERLAEKVQKMHADMAIKEAASGAMAIPNPGFAYVPLRLTDHAQRAAWARAADTRAVRDRASSGARVTGQEQAHLHRATNRYFYRTDEANPYWVDESGDGWNYVWAGEVSDGRNLPADFIAYRKAFVRENPDKMLPGDIYDYNLAIQQAGGNPGQYLPTPGWRGNPIGNPNGERWLPQVYATSPTELNRPSTSHRFSDMLGSEYKGQIWETDLGLILGKRVREHWRSAAVSDFLKSIAPEMKALTLDEVKDAVINPRQGNIVNQGGRDIIINNVAYRRLSEEVRTNKMTEALLGGGAKSYYYPEDVAAALDDYIRRISDDQNITAIGNAFDYVQSIWKGSVLMNPAWTTVNVLGGVIHSMIVGGMSLGDFTEHFMTAKRLSHQFHFGNRKGKIIPTGPGMIFDDAKTYTLGGETLTETEMVEHLVKINAVDGSQTAREVINLHRTAFGNPDAYAKKTILDQVRYIATFGPLGGWWFRLNASIDDTFRTAVYLSRRAKGDTVDNAVLMMKKAHFDYGDFTKLEEKVGRRVIPFYAWQRNNIALQYKLLFDRPGYVNVWQKIRHAMEVEGLDEEDRVPLFMLPRWIRNQLMIQMSGEGGEAKGLVLSSLTPIQELLQTAQAAFGVEGFKDMSKYMLGSSSPILKSLFEMGTGQRVFDSRKIGDPELGELTISEYMLDQVGYYNSYKGLERAVTRDGLEGLLWRLAVRGRWQPLDIDRLQAQISIDTSEDIKLLRRQVNRAMQEGDEERAETIGLRIINEYRKMWLAGIRHRVPKELWPEFNREGGMLRREGRPVPGSNLPIQPKTQ